MRILFTILLLCSALASHAVMRPGSATSLKLELLKVFLSAKNDDLSSVTKDNSTVDNFTQFTEAHPSTITIQNTKYSVVYGVDNNKKAWTCVINEWDSYSPSINKQYAEFLTLLQEAFSAENGWTSFEMKMNKSDELSDIIFKKPGYGYIVLDFSKNINGNYALEIRVTPKISPTCDIAEELSKMNYTVMAK